MTSNKLASQMEQRIRELGPASNVIAGIAMPFAALSSLIPTDRKNISWWAVMNADISDFDICDMMLEAVE